MSDETRRERFPVGFAHLGLNTVEREVPVDEPPALAANADLRLIGKSVPRWDARAKVTGSACYTVDVHLPGLLHAAVLHSPLPHARLRSLDLSSAAAAPGVRAAMKLITPSATDDNGIIRYVGQPVAVVAAETQAQAHAALQLIDVEYESLPFVIDLQAAKQAMAATVYRSEDLAQVASAGLPANAADYVLQGNVLGPTNQPTRGDVTAGFAQASVIVERRFQTQVQTHCCMEPHAIVADWRDDNLEVWMSTQFTAGVRTQFAREFQLPLDRVRVHAEAVGGGFGSKSQMGWYGRTAVALSRLAKAPVKLFFHRDEEQMDSGNRACSEQHLRVGAHTDGSLAAIALESYGSAGVAFGAGVGWIADAMYQCPHVAIKQYDVFMHTSPSTAMRGPGNTQGAFALEQCIDELAVQLEIDPIALRDKIDASPVRREERRLGAERIGWSRRTPPGADKGHLKRGIGMAQSMWPALIQINAACEVRVWRDGGVEILSSVQDIGTGVGTTLAQVVAEELGLEAEAIRVRIGDTEFPSGPPSYGSRTTASITPPARVAAWRVKQSLLAVVAEAWQVPVQDLCVQAGHIQFAKEPGKRLEWRDATTMLRTDRISATAGRGDDYAGFRSQSGDAAFALTDLGGVQFAEVEVDTETGVIRVLRVVAAQDCGRPINPLQVESQVQGGVLMGVSYALFEDRVMDAQTGRMLNPNFVDYKLLGMRDAPDIEVMLLENYQGFSATDAYGIAEPSNIPTAPAIANAVYNAIGVRIDTLPMTPARVLTALANEAGARR